MSGPGAPSHRPRHRDGRPRRARVAAGVVVAAGLLASACGFPAEDQPRLLDPDEVGYELLSPTTSPPTTLSPSVETDRVVLYLIDAEDGLVHPVAREVARPKNPARVIQALFDSRPTEEEAEEGLSNVITRQTRLRAVRVAGRRVMLDLDSYFPGLTSEEVSFAIAQIVFTVDELIPGAELAISVRDQAEDLRLNDGKSVPDVSRQDLAADFDPQDPANAPMPTPSTSVATPTSTPAG